MREQIALRMQQLRDSKMGKVSLASALLLTISAPSHAALDTAVTDAFTSLTASIGDYATPAYALLSAVLLFFIGMKWFKSVANKAT